MPLETVLLPSTWKGLKDGRLQSFSTHIADREIPILAYPGSVSGVWYAEVQILEDEPSSVFALGVLHRLIESKDSPLHEPQSPSNDVSGALFLRGKVDNAEAALPGLLPHSIAYMSTGTILSSEALAEAASDFQRPSLATAISSFSEEDTQRGRGSETRSPTGS